MALAPPYFIFPFPDDIPEMKSSFSDSNSSGKEDSLQSAIKNIISIVSKTFKRPEYVELPIKDDANLQSSIQNILGIITKTFKKPEYVELPIKDDANLHSSIENIIGIITKTFRGPILVADKKAENSKEEEFTSSSTSNKKPKKYMVDYTPERCMKRLEESPMFNNIAKYYEPTNTYEDPQSKTGICVYKLKTMNKKEEENMKDEEKEKIKEMEYTIKIQS